MKNEGGEGEVFFDFKRRKKWNDEKCGHKCLMLYAKAIDIAWGANSQYWTWDCYKETGDDNIQVAKLLTVSYLDMVGRVSLSFLSPGVLYETVYKVKLTNGGSGWEIPVTTVIQLPGGIVKRRVVSLLDIPRNQWVEINGGTFRTAEDGEEEDGILAFHLQEHGGHWKNGLIVKAMIVRPKHP